MTTPLLTTKRVQRHMREALEAERLSQKYRRMGRKAESAFWASVYQEKLSDAGIRPGKGVRREARKQRGLEAGGVHVRGGDRSCRGDTAPDGTNGMSNGKTTENGAHNRNTRK